MNQSGKNDNNSKLMNLSTMTCSTVATSHATRTTNAAAAAAAAVCPNEDQQQVWQTQLPLRHAKRPKLQVDHDDMTSHHHPDDTNMMATTVTTTTTTTTTAAPLPSLFLSQEAIHNDLEEVQAALTSQSHQWTQMVQNTERIGGGDYGHASDVGNQLP